MLLLAKFESKDTYIQPRKHSDMRYFALLVFFFALTFANGQTVKVMTYNIHHGNPPAQKGVIDLEAIAQVINDAKVDAVGIQEVDVYVSRSNLEDQAERLAALTNCNYYFVRSIGLENGSYGTLVLTKHKIIGKRKYDLPMPVQSENRTLGVVDIELPNGKSFSLANTHLDLKEENKIAQAKYINELGELYSRPLILVGDLNAKPDSGPIQLLEEYFVRNKKGKATFPNVNPQEEIDYIMVSKHSKFKWKSYVVLTQADTQSDHVPLVAEIKFK